MRMILSITIALIVGLIVGTLVGESNAYEHMIKDKEQQHEHSNDIEQ